MTAAAASIAVGILLLAAILFLSVTADRSVSVVPNAKPGEFLFVTKPDASSVPKKTKHTYASKKKSSARQQRDVSDPTSADAASSDADPKDQNAAEDAQPSASDDLANAIQADALITKRLNNEEQAKIVAARSPQP